MFNLMATNIHYKQRRSVLVTCLICIAALVFGFWSHDPSSSLLLGNLSLRIHRAASQSGHILKNSKPSVGLPVLADEAKLLPRLALEVLEELQAQIDLETPEGTGHRHHKRPANNSTSLLSKRGLLSVFGPLVGEGSASSSGEGSTASASAGEGSSAGSGGGGLLNDLGGLFGAGAGGGSSGNGGGGLLSGLGGLLGGGTGSGIEGIISNVVSGVVTQAINGEGPFGGLVDSLAEPALSLGTGIGSGAISGSSLKSSTANTSGTASKGGINAVAQNFGFGLSSSVAGSINASKVFEGVTQQIPGAAFSLAQGLGSGGASSLKLSSTAVEPSNDSSLSAIAGNLGLGLSTGALGGINFDSATQQALLSQVSQAIVPAAQGLGQGTAQGLNLTGSSNTVGGDLSSKSLSIQSVARGFTQELSSSFLDSVDFSKAISPETQQQLLSQAAQAVIPAAQGLGQGAAQGLQLVNSSKTDVASSSGNSSIPDLARGFTQGLSSSFLGSIDFSKAVNSQSSQQLLSQAAQAVVPAAQGLGQGAAQGLQLTNASSITDLSSSNNLSISNLAHGFTQGLASSFLGSADLSKLVTPEAQQELFSQAAQAVIPAAQGLGQGAAQGLKLTNSTSIEDVSSSNNLSVPSLAHGFSQGLASSFFGSVDLSTALSPQNQKQLLSQVAQAVIPAAQGLGQGAAQGLNLANYSGTANINSSDLSISGLAHGFTQGLASSFVGSVDISKAVTPQAQQQLIAQVAQAVVPAAQGLGQGAAQGLKLTNASGVENINSTDLSISSAAHGFTQGLASSFLGSLDLSTAISPQVQQQIMAQIAQAIVPAAQGIGQGAAEGLNLTNSSSSTDVELPSATSLSVPGAAQGFARGLASSFLGSVDLSRAVTPEAQQQLMNQLVGAIPSVGKGLGEGAAQGLKLINPSTTLDGRDLSLSLNGTNVNQLSEQFSQSLSSSFLGSVDLSNAFSATQQQALLVQAVGAVGDIGKGLGQGAAQGLGLADSSTSSGDPSILPNGTISIGGVGEAFTRSLSAAFLGSANLSSVSGSSMLGLSNLQSQIGPAALGLGRGLGSGAAIGLGFQAADATNMSANDGDTSGMVTMVTEMFGQGLTESFLAGGTLQALQNKFTAATASIGGINISSAAEFLSSGLVGGAGQALAANGGLSALTGSPGADQSVLIQSPAQNDTVGQAAFGFGQGLGNSGVDLFFQLFGKSNTTQTSAAVVATPKKRRSLIASTLLQDSGKRKNAERGLILVAQDASGASSLAGDALNLLNFTAINTAVQEGVDDLTCEGVGGLVAVLFGLVESGTVKLPSTSSINIPINQDFTIRNDGNVFTANFATKQISVNGSDVIRFAVLLGLHILFAGVLFMLIIPTVTSVEALRDVFIMMNKPNLLNKADWWLKSSQLFVVPFLLLLTLIFGFMAVGNGPQLSTAHEILGLILALQTILATVLYQACRNGGTKNPRLAIARQINTILLLVLTNATVFTGFGDLSSVSLCITQIIPFSVVAATGSGLTMVFAQALGLLGLKLLVRQLLQNSCQRSDGGREGSRQTYSGTTVNAGNIEQNLVSTWSLLSQGEDTLNAIDIECLSTGDLQNLTQVGTSIEPGMQWLAYKNSIDPDMGGWTNANGFNTSPGIILDQFINEFNMLSWDSLQIWSISFFNGSTANYSSYGLPTGRAIPERIYNALSAKTSVAGFDFLFGIIADSVTTHIRQNGDTSLFPNSTQLPVGTFIENDTCITMRWAWLAYPAAIICLTVVFFIFTVIETRWQQRFGHDWKSCSLALVNHGLDPGLLEKHYCQEISTVDNRVGHVKDLRVQPKLTTKGWKLISRS